MFHVLTAFFFFFFNDTATTEIYTLSLHDALPISCLSKARSCGFRSPYANSSSALPSGLQRKTAPVSGTETVRPSAVRRSEEHTSELQSRQYLVCRLLLEKKKKSIDQYIHYICEVK